MPDQLAEIAYRLSVGIVTLRDTDYLLRRVKAAEMALNATTIGEAKLATDAWQRIAVARCCVSHRMPCRKSRGLVGLMPKAALFSTVNP
mgnify:CR=1 FL=1